MAEEHATERDIVEGLRRGDPGSLETLFRLHYPSLRTFAESIARSAAEDVVQDVFTNLWRSRRQLEIRTSLRAYLYRAVRNRALNERRAAALARKARENVSILAPDAPPDALETAIGRESAESVRKAVAALSPRCREVIELRWRHHLSHGEIAEALGISKKGVEIQITRGLRALREALGD